MVLLVFLVYGVFPNRWYHVLYIYSGSMQPTFLSGDLIVITPKPDKLEPGMVVTMNVSGQYVTHRFLGLQPDGTLLTKGDNNPVIDNWENIPVKVVGYYRFRIPYLGYLVDLVDVFSPSASGAWFFDEDIIDVRISTVPKSENKISGTSISADATAAGAFDEVSEKISVSGEICVDNQGETDTDGLRILAQIEYKTKGGGEFQPLPSASIYFEPIEVLLPAQTRCYAYRISFSPVEEAHYRLAAQVLINNHSGWMPGGPHCDLSDTCPFGPVVKSDFELPKGDSSVEECGKGTQAPDPETTELPTLTQEPTPEITQLPTSTPEPTPEMTEPPDSTPEPTPESVNPETTDPATSTDSPDDLPEETPTPQASDDLESTPDPSVSE